jgi:hypothetical protein
MVWLLPGWHMMAKTYHVMLYMLFLKDAIPCVLELEASLS